jgi:hypothetical protein
MILRPVAPKDPPLSLKDLSTKPLACPFWIIIVASGFLMVTMRRKKAKKRRFRPFLGLVSWWKRRKFYFVQQDVLDEEESMLSEQKGLVQGKASIPLLNHPSTTYFHGPRAPQNPRYPLTRNTTIDSFQDSIESMDSLVESYWDPDDETSQATAVASNTGQYGQQADFLLEHLNFLSVQTQPREVEVVYDS